MDFTRLFDLVWTEMTTEEERAHNNTPEKRIRFILDKLVTIGTSATNCLDELNAAERHRQGRRRNHTLPREAHHQIEADFTFDSDDAKNMSASGLVDAQLRAANFENLGDGKHWQRPRRFP